MSKPKTILLAEATKAEMQQFAIDHLGLPESPANILPETLRAKIAAAWDKDEITIIAQDKPDNKPTRAEAAELDDGEGEDDDFITVFIEKTEETGGDQPVWVDVNGRGIWVPRGEEARIRKCYEHVLQNAVRTVYDQTTGPDGKPGPMVPREALGYPYRRVA